MVIISQCHFFILQLMISTAIITEEVIFVLITRNRQNTDISIVGDKRPNVPILIAKGSPKTALKSRVQVFVKG